MFKTTNQRSFIVAHAWCAVGHPLEFSQNSPNICLALGTPGSDSPASPANNETSWHDPKLCHTWELSMGAINHPKLIVPPDGCCQVTGICFACLPGSFPVTFGTSPSPLQGLAASASACHSSVGPRKRETFKADFLMDLLPAHSDWRPGA